MTLTPVGIQENKTLTEEQLSVAEEVIGEIQKRCMWLIGDCYRIRNERGWGNQHTESVYDDCEDRFGIKYQTAANAASVCETFCLQNVR